MLREARRDVPGYRAVKDDNLHGFPVLKKEAVRSAPEAFVSESASKDGTDREHTSGSTGTPLQIVISRQATRNWYALHEARTLRWNNVRRSDRWAILGGQPIVAPDAAKPPYWVWNRPMRQLYLSSYHLSERTVSDYFGALHRHRVRYLLGYPSAMDTLARLGSEAGFEVPHLEVAIANAEPLYDRQRSAIEQAFQCPVRETYGLAEFVVGASECEAGQLHLWPEVGMVEILAEDSDRPLPAGETGRVVCTGLLNPAMPLIRYDTGDRGRLSSTAEPCACGRSLPVLAAIEGRQDDVVSLPDGRRIGRLDPILKGNLPIRECQVVQTAADRLVFRVVPAPSFGAGEQEALLDSARAFLGSSVQIEIERVESLPRGPNGKLRGVVSEVGASS